MLVEIKKIDAVVVDRLFAVYAESMEDLAADFGSADDMRADYEGFLREFIRKPGQLILVEADGDDWVSALRAIEYRPSVWFMEAVETAPDRRGQGFGRRLLNHSVERLLSLGAQRIECIIHPDNTASQCLHASCGFVPTDDKPVNCWGETETGCILWRYSHGGTGKEQKKESNWRFVEVTR